jgi:hypothetical protein
LIDNPATVGIGHVLKNTGAPDINAEEKPAEEKPAHPFTQHSTYTGLGCAICAKSAESHQSDKDTPNGKH